MANRLIPVGVDNDSEKVHDSLCKLIAKIAGAGYKMDVYCNLVSVNLIASFDRYFNNEITCDKLIDRINSTVLPED